VIQNKSRGAFKAILSYNHSSQGSEEELKKSDEEQKKNRWERAISPVPRLGEEVGRKERVAPGGCGGLLEELVRAAEGVRLVGEEHAQHPHAVGGGSSRRGHVGQPGHVDRRSLLRLLPPPAPIASRQKGRSVPAGAPPRIGRAGGRARLGLGVRALT